jgi:hypothetical protein
MAVHHPPFSYAPAKGAGGAGGNHSSSSAMLREIDTICKQQGIYPHAVISGHAHNYQRYRNLRARADLRQSRQTAPNSLPERVDVRHATAGSAHSC